MKLDTKKFLIGAFVVIGWLSFIFIVSPTINASTSTITGTIQDEQGNPLNGYVTMQLPVPAQDTATNTHVAPVPVRYNIVNGVIQSGPPLYDVAGLQPQNLYYITKFYDSAGQLVSSGNYIVTGASFNLGAATPTNITTNNVSYISPVSLSASNTWTGTQTFSQPIVSSVSTGTSPFNITSTTLVPNLNVGTLDSVVVTGVPTPGQVPVATSGTAASWQTPTSGAGSASQISPATNFGTALPAQTVLGSVVATGEVDISISAVQTTLGVGCSSTGNNATPALQWTAPGGTAENTSLVTLTVTGNGTLDSGSFNGNAAKITAKAGTAITYTTTSSLGSTGCTTTPQYTVYAKAVY